MVKTCLPIALAVCVATESPGQAVPAGPRPPMGFFITSVGPGDGGNLGGLAGADAHCLKLAQAFGNSSWNAAHASRGCGQADLVASGGAGLFYCFAAN